MEMTWGKTDSAKSDLSSGTRILANIVLFPLLIPRRCKGDVESGDGMLLLEMEIEISGSEIIFNSQLNRPSPPLQVIKDPIFHEFVHHFARQNRPCGIAARPIPFRSLLPEPGHNAQ